MSAEIQKPGKLTTWLQKTWLFGHFYEESGGKYVPRKFAKTIFATFVATIAVVSMLSSSGEVTVLIGRSPIETSSVDLGDGQSIEINRVDESARQKASPARSKAFRYSGPQVVSRPRIDKIPPGLMVKAVLISGASNGILRAELSEDLEFNNGILLERGTILVGRGNSTEERLYIKFDQMVLRDGSVALVSASACDASDRIVGLKGSKVGSHAWRMAGAVGLGFIGGLSEGLQDSHGEGGVEVQAPSMKNALLKGTTQAALDQSRELMSQVKDKQPIIEIQAGTTIFVMMEGQ